MDSGFRRNDEKKDRLGSPHPSQPTALMIIYRVGFALLLCLLAARSAQTQIPGSSNEPNVPEKAGKELHALRIAGGAPRIDGILDDAIWDAAPAIEDLVQQDPDNLAAPTER